MYTYGSGVMAWELRQITLLKIICLVNFIYKYYIYDISSRRNVGPGTHREALEKLGTLNTQVVSSKEDIYVLPVFCLKFRS